VDPAAVEAFERLLELLGLETRWAALFADWIDANTTANSPDGGEDNLYLSQAPPYRPPNMAITSVSELLALPEFGRERYLLLAKHVAALPVDAPLNVCLASGEVLDAYNEGQREHTTDQEAFAKSQAEGCFPGLAAYEASFDPAVLTRVKNWPGLAETTRYFRLTSVVSIGTAQFAMYSLLRREDDGRVRVVMRSYSPD
jgi:general secretion pathway protein K